MSRFDKKYLYDEKIKSAKQLLAQRKDKEAEKIFLECYTYFDDEHLIAEKLETIKNLIEIYLNLNDYESAKFYLEIYELESKENNIPLPPDIYHSFGRLYSNQGELKKSIEFYKQAIDISLKNNNELGAAISALNLGEQLKHIGDFDEAIKYFTYSRNIFIKNNRSELSLSPFIAELNMLILLNRSIIPVELERLEYVLQLISQIKSPTLATNYINVGRIFQVLEKFDKAIFYLKKAIKISEEIAYEKTLYHAYLNLAYVYDNLGEFEKALKYMNKAQNYYIEKQDNQSLARVYNGLGLISKNKGDFTKAVKYIESSTKLGKEFYDFELELRNYELLGDIYKNTEKYEDAILVYNKLLNIFEELLKKTQFAGLKLIFKSQFSRIMQILQSIISLLKAERIRPNLEVLEDIEESSLKICKTSSEFLETAQFLEIQREVQDLKSLIMNIKGPYLENDTRKLFLKKGYKKVHMFGKNIMLDEKEIKYLVDKGCIKDNSTKTIELDLFAKRKERNRTIYAIGECKFEKKPISIKDIKCFIIKACITAKKYLGHKKDTSDEYTPKFELIIISFSGFPEDEKIKECLRKNWKLPNSALEYFNIETIDGDFFIILLEDFGIQSFFYKKMKDLNL